MLNSVCGFGDSQRPCDTSFPKVKALIVVCICRGWEDSKVVKNLRSPLQFYPDIIGIQVYFILLHYVLLHFADNELHQYGGKTLHQTKGYNLLKAEMMVSIF